MVSVMPCTAKKFEVARSEMKNNELPNVDAVAPVVVSQAVGNQDPKT